MIDGHIAALAYELERDGPSDTGCAAGYGGGFAFEETPVRWCHFQVKQDMMDEIGVLKWLLGFLY
jgi:hypothetical protein